MEKNNPMEVVENRLSYTIKMRFSMNEEQSRYIQSFKDKVCRRAEELTFAKVGNGEPACVLCFRKTNPLLSYQIKFYDGYASFVGGCSRLRNLKALQEIARVEIRALLDVGRRVHSHVPDKRGSLKKP